MSNNVGPDGEFSTYGNYAVRDNLVLSFPKTQIKIQRMSTNIFTYFRRNADGQITEKIITTSSDSLELEICPVLPMNLPARKTNDLMFLRFEKQVYVSRNSAIDIFAPFPIEIGVFVEANQKDAAFLDCFTCESLHSRFGLYGSPANGNLCMYAKVPVQKHRESFIYALTKISIKNKTNKGVLVGKVVFPVSEHNMYYVDKTTEAHIDDLEMIIEDELGKNIATVTCMEYTKEKQNWRIAPSIEKKIGKRSIFNG